MKVRVISGTYVGAPVNRTVTEGEVLDVPAELGAQLKGMGRVEAYTEPKKAEPKPEPKAEEKEEPESKQGKKK